MKPYQEYPLINMEQSSTSILGTKTAAGAAVDVIIPVYNGAKYITETIQSVLKQTKLPHSIIVVDDGSTDTTAAIIKGLGETSPVPVILIQQKNCGLSAARNAGIKVATAPYTGLLDADDLWSPEKLAQQLGVFETADGTLGAVYCAYDLIDESGEKLDVEHMEIDPAVRGNIFSNLLEGNKVTGSASGILVRRSVFDTTGGFDESLTSYEDWDMWLRIARTYTFDYTPETLVHIRRHHSNMQKAYSKMLDNEIRFYNKWTKELGTRTPRTWKDKIALSVIVTFPHLYRSIRAVERSLTKNAKRVLFGRYTSLTIYLPIYLATRLFHRVCKIFSL